MIQVIVIYDQPVVLQRIVACIAGVIGNFLQEVAPYPIYAWTK